MGNVQYRADGHHVDEAGNLICCTYVDLRPAAGHLPVGALKKASSKRHAIPGCDTIRISKPSRFDDQGEGLSASAGADGAEVESGGNAWVYCAFIEPQTRAQQAAWRAAMPAGRDAVSPIRRPREFARALGAMVAEQVGPQGRPTLLRSTVSRPAFRTAHRSQTVYHGPVVYADDPYRRLESASSVLELALLRVFMKPTTHRGQREYRFALWADAEPERDRVDLKVSPALLDAMQRPPPEPERGGVVPAGIDEPSAVEEVDHPDSSAVRVVVEAPAAFAVVNHPTVAPPRYRAEDLPADLHETAAVRAAVEALRAAVDQVDRRSDPGRRRGGVARGVGRAVLLLDLRGHRRRGARERGPLHRDHGRNLRARAHRGEDRSRAGRNLRVQGEHRPWRPSGVRRTRRSRVRTGLGEPSGRSGSARWYRRCPRLT